MGMGKWNKGAMEGQNGVVSGSGEGQIGLGKVVMCIMLVHFLTNYNPINTRRLYFNMLFTVRKDQQHCNVEKLQSCISFV